MTPVPRKYICYRNGVLVLLAYSKVQVQRFLHLNEYEKNRKLLEIKVNDNTKIDFNLIHFRQFEYTPDRIPFTSRAYIRKSCRFCKKTIFFSYECWHCTNSWVRKQAAQISDQDYQILEKCCGRFVPGFYEELNNNV